MKKAILILIFGALLCLTANSQNTTLTTDQVKQVTDQVEAETGIIINFDDVLKAGGVLITTDKASLPDKIVTVFLENDAVIVYLKD